MKHLVYNTYMQIFALFDDKVEAEILRDKMRAAGYMVAVKEVNEFYSGLKAFDAVQPAPIVLKSTPAPTRGENLNRRRSDNVSAPSHRYGHGGASDSGYRNDSSLFQQTIDSFSDSSSGDSGSSCGGD